MRPTHPTNLTPNSLTQPVAVNQEREATFSEFVLLGVSHHEAGVDVREQFSLASEAQQSLMQEAYDMGARSLLVIATCNRTEIFARYDQPMALAQLLDRYVSGSTDTFEQYGHVRQGPLAVEKLFEIAAGLDSQILGDLQIINQVKEAYRTSCDAGFADSQLHRLMQHVLRAHKRIRHETSLGKGAASVARAAVQFVLAHVGSLQDKNLLLVGTGKIGKVTCYNLVDHHPRSLTLLNRNRERAERIADRLAIHAGGLEELAPAVAQADVVIVATGADEPILDREHLQCPVVGNKILLDLSIPRNIARDVAAVPNVQLADLDDLNATSDAAYQERLASIEPARELIRHEVGRYEAWLASQRVAPTIRALQDKLEQIRSEEMAFFRNKLAPEDRDKAEQLTHRIVKKIAAHSIEHLRAHPEASEALTGMVQEMFKLELEHQNSED